VKRLTSEREIVVSTLVSIVSHIKKIEKKRVLNVSKSMFGSATADPKRAFEVSKARFKKKSDVW
jgi:hypothetical protein